MAIVKDDDKDGGSKKASPHSGTKMQTKLLKRLGLGLYSRQHDPKPLFRPSLVSHLLNSSDLRLEASSSSSLDRKHYTFAKISERGCNVFFISSNSRKKVKVKFADDNTIDKASSSKDSSKDEKTDGEKEIKKRDSVKFAKYADVVEIPNRNAYSLEQQEQMWYGNKTLRDITKRNTLEYQWEGWDWRFVVEEKEFCNYRGSSLHPAHLPLDYMDESDASNDNNSQPRRSLKSKLEAALSKSTRDLQSLLDQEQFSEDHSS